MVDSVKVSEYSDCTRERPSQKKREVAFLETEALPVLNHNNEREYKRYNITEKAFFGSRQIARQTHKSAHQRETKRRDYYQYYSLVFFIFKHF